MLQSVKDDYKTTPISDGINIRCKGNPEANTREINWSIALREAGSL